MTVGTDITIKKNDGTTNIVYTLLTGSGGDNSPALWRSQTAPGTAGQQPFLSLQSRNNGSANVRREDILFVFPSIYTDTQGNTVIRSKAVFQGSWALPLDMPTADMNEAGAQLGNLIASAMVAGALKSGYAPT